MANHLAKNRHKRLAKVREARTKRLRASVHSNSTKGKRGPVSLRRNLAN